MDNNPLKLNEQTCAIMRARAAEREIANSRFQDALACIGSAMGIDNTKYVLDIPSMTWVLRPEKKEV
jgi:hypothetical protein